MRGVEEFSDPLPIDDDENGRKLGLFDPGDFPPCPPIPLGMNERLAPFIVCCLCLFTSSRFAIRPRRGGSADRLDRLLADDAGTL
mmetsp:Transcript_9318/g.21131  ORF Transcript_9318/g.21131 Transcript_9318/m.21131 type:complete len:85 (-) Transcript_9318:904-1158(-)